MDHDEHDRLYINHGMAEPLIDVMERILYVLFRSLRAPTL